MCIRNWKLHYGWIICLCCTLVSICSTGLLSNVFSAYMPHLQKAGFTAAQTSLTVSVRCLFMALGLLFVTRYYRVLGLRTGLAISCCISTAGSLLYAVASSLPMLYTASAVCGIATAMGSMVPISILLKKWFTTHRGLAVGISASGTGIAAVVFPPLITKVVAAYGLAAAFIVQGAFCFLCAIVMFLLLRNKPEDVALHSYGEGEPEEPKAVAARPRPGLTKGQWALILVSLLLFGGASCGTPSHISVMLMSDGTPEMVASLCVSIFGLSLMVGKWMYGWVVDKLGTYRATYIFFTALILGMISFCFAGRVGGILPYVSVLLIGFGFPPATVGISMWASDLSDEANYAGTFKWFQTTYIVGGMLLANLPGITRDLFGSYFLAFIFFIASLVFTLVAVQLIYRKHGAHM